MSSSISCVSVTQDMFVFKFLESLQVGVGGVNFRPHPSGVRVWSNVQHISKCKPGK